VNQIDSKEELHDLARAFIREAFVALRQDHVIPTPRFNPFVAIGRDYFGDKYMAPRITHSSLV
jgi:hypothetical protein